MGLCPLKKELGKCAKNRISKTYLKELSAILCTLRPKKIYIKNPNQIGWGLVVNRTKSHWLHGGCNTFDHHQDNHLAHRDTSLHDLFRLVLAFGVPLETHRGCRNNLGKLPSNEGNKVDGNHIDN